MMKTTIQEGQRVSLKEFYMPDEGPWSFPRGSVGKVLGWDNGLLRVRMYEHSMTICINARILEPALHSEEAA
jgi:hypothetical protein